MVATARDVRKGDRILHEDVYYEVIHGITCPSEDALMLDLSLDGVRKEISIYLRTDAQIARQKRLE